MFILGLAVLNSDWEKKTLKKKSSLCPKKLKGLMIIINFKISYNIIQVCKHMGENIFSLLEIKATKL